MRSHLVLSLAAGLVVLAALGCSEEKSSDGDELPPAGLAGGDGSAPSGDDAAPGATDPAAAPAGGSFKDLEATDVILTVGEQKYTKDDHERAMLHQAAMIGVPPGQLPPQLRGPLEAPAYRSLEKRGMLYTEAKNAGVVATEEEVKAQKDKLLSSLPPGRTLADVLKAMQSTEEDFMTDLKVDMSIGKLMEKTYKELPVVDEKQAREIYEKNPERYQNNDKVKAAHILVQLAPSASPDQVAAAEKRAKEIHAKVAGKDKATFTKVAKAESDDPGSKNRGGELGAFTAREMLPAFAQAAFALKKGEVSDVVRTEKGLHIIRSEGKESGKLAFDDVKARIIATAAIEKRQQVERDLLTRLQKEVKVERHHKPDAPLPPLVGPARPAMGAPGGPPQPMPMPPMPAPGAPGMGAPPGDGSHQLPLPSKDNVMPGMQNPHGGNDLKLDPGGAPAGNLKLKLNMDGAGG